MPFKTDQPSYQRLRTIHAERRRPIVFWVGAGLSQPAGLPSWIDLRDTLIARTLEIAATLPEAEGAEKEAAMERAANASSLWDAFQVLKREMGRTEFREEIRQILERSLVAEIPDTYRAIWTLPGVRGMLTLNLDGFASRSHKRARLTEDPAIFSGRDAADYAHILGAGRAFIGNLHGVADAQKSWVFTRDEISALTGSPGYKDFIGFIFSQMTVVFCGISAEDSAAGGFLAVLTRSGLDLGSHFWITDRTDAVTREWAGDAGLGIIVYSPIRQPPKLPDHTTPLLELCEDLRRYVSKNVNAPPLIPDVPSIDSLPGVRELLGADVDHLRTLLSGYSKGLLKQQGSENTSVYQDFLREYAPCIHQAWWLTSNKPYNKFYDYDIEKQVSSSPFSTVWRLKARDGSALALKVLRMENLINGAEIDSFRRGIQSLGFLTKATVPGTPRLVSAFEIPTSLIMEFVEGDSLQQLVSAGTFDPWVDGIRIMESVCEHLRFGHNLPQGVLHRDVRPSNVMVPHYYWQVENTDLPFRKHDVNLLNYDMSWHAHAQGQTVAGNIEESGYYAPEYVSAGSEAARTTLVDSYGVGMCIYFSFTRQRPPAGGSKSTDWMSLLEQGFRIHPKLNWRSAPMRVRRLIERATSPNPEDRPMIDQIGAELALIRQAIDGETSALPADYWAEELISQSEQASYTTDLTGISFAREPRPGRKIAIEGDIRSRRVTVSFRNQGLPSTNRSGVDRMWSEKLQKARGILASAGWDISDDSRSGRMELLLRAEVLVSDLAGNFSRLLTGLQRGLEQVRIE